MPTGMLELSFAPPIRPPLWKFLGKTSEPNLCSWSLFHAMFFLLTSKTLFLTENLYVSLNKLHAIRPQGTIGALFDVTASGLQSSVTPSLALLFNCLSLRLFTYLEEIFHISTGENIQKDLEVPRIMHMLLDTWTIREPLNPKAF